MPRTLRRVLIGVVACIVVLAGIAGWEVYHVYTGLNKITGVTVPRGKRDPYRNVLPPAINTKQRINFLLLGSDNDAKKEEARPLTQSMILVTLDPIHYKVGLLSIPRDFWVPIPGHKYAKIDLAHKYGGVALARETVERLFHVPVDYYAWVGLTGFVRVIDTFGGVTVDASHPVLDDEYPNDLSDANPYAFKRIFIPAGWQHMDGHQALEYVRSRHGDYVGDFGRSTRQQQVLVQVQHKINALSVLTNLPVLVDELQNYVRTDLTLRQLYELDQLSHHIHTGDITKVVLSVPTYGQYATSPDGQSIVQPNWTTINPVVRQLFAPVRATAPPAGGSRPRPPSRSTSKQPHQPGVQRSGQPKAGPTPAPRSVPGLPAQLPGNLYYAANGNLYELTRNRSVKQLTFQGDALMPNPSPDGKWVSFVRFTNGLHKYGKYASDVWLLDPRTLRQHVITNDESAVAENNIWAAWPSWSADGQRIAFSTDRAKLGLGLPSETRPVDLTVWQMAGQGGQQVQLTVAPRGGGGDTDPAWRPRSPQQLLFVRWAYPASGTRPYSQLVVQTSGSNALTYLTPAGGRVLQPAWNRTGDKVAYVEEPGNGADQIVVASVNRSPGSPRLSHRAVLAQGRVGQPSFSPDGKWVSYLQADGDGFDLYMQSISGGPSFKLGEAGPSLDGRSRPVWGQ